MRGLPGILFRRDVALAVFLILKLVAVLVAGFSLGTVEVWTIGVLTLAVYGIIAWFALQRRTISIWAITIIMLYEGSGALLTGFDQFGSAPAIERKKGFEAVIGQFPGMEIVRSQSGDFTTEGGKKVMEAFIKATNNLEGICASFAHNDNMQLGAIQAMKEATASLVGPDAGREMAVYFDYICSGLGN